MMFEITLDMEVLGEDDTILVKDEFGEYPDSEYVPKFMYDDLRAENAKLHELVQDFDKCLDTALCLAHDAGYSVMPDQKLFDSLRPRMLDLGIEVPE